MITVNPRFSIILAALLTALIICNSICTVFAQEGVGVILPDPSVLPRVAQAGPDAKWSTIDLTYAAFVANLWNLASGAQGIMIMNYTKNYVEVYGNFTNLPTTVAIQGGPGVRYGRSLWGESPPSHPVYKIPKKIVELPYAILFINYTIYEKESTLPLTTTLYIWTVKALRQQGPQAGDLLIIVRTYNHPGRPITGTPAARVVAPLIINGSLNYVNFAVFTSNIEKTGGHTAVVFEPLNLSIRNGRVGIPIQEYISLTATLLPQLAPNIWSSEEVLGHILQMMDIFVDWYSNKEGKGVFRWRMYEVSIMSGANVIAITTTRTTTITFTATTTITQTQLSTVISSITLTATKELTETLTTTLTRTEVRTTTIATEVVKTEVDWLITVGVGVVLLVVGLAIGMVLRKRS